MCVGPVKDMMQPKVINNPPAPAPEAPEPPPVPITRPTLADAEAPELTIKKKAKSGNPLRIDRAPSSGGSSGVNLPY